MMAAMGIAGFGKQQKQRRLDPKRFDKSKRAEVRHPIASLLVVRLTDQHTGLACAGVGPRS